MNKVYELLLEKPDYNELSLYLNMPDVVKWICDNDIFYKNIDKIIDNYGKLVGYIMNQIAIYNEKYILSNGLSLMPYYIKGKIDTNCIFAIRNIGCDKIVEYLKK